MFLVRLIDKNKKMRQIKLHFALNYWQRFFKEKTNFKYWMRDSTIILNFFKTRASVYNGKKWKIFYIYFNRLYKKLGEYSKTREICI